jgi:anaerobic selenocysteine-containing dehydrogenase
MEELKVPAFCTQCRSRCGCMAVVVNNKLDRIEPLDSHPSGSKLCPKGKAAPELVYHPDRLTQPLRRVSSKGKASPSWQVISWDEAMDEITENMVRIRDDYGAEQVAFSVTTPSGTHISDSISWVQRFIRAFGSPNTIYGTEICNWHKDFASRFTYGFDMGTPDFKNTDCVLLWGHNPTATWLARSTEVQQATRRGAKLIVVDPRPTMLAKRADCWLRVKPGTDQALALGIANVMITEGGFDHQFLIEWTNASFLVRNDNDKFLRQSDLTKGGDSATLMACHTDGRTLLGYDTTKGRWLGDDNVSLNGEYLAETEEGLIPCRSAFSLYADTASELPLEIVEELTGVSVTDIRLAAKILMSAGTTAYYAWNGISQSLTATQTDRAVSLLYTLTGSYGEQGGNMPGSAAPFADISGCDLLNESQSAKALGLEERPLGPGRFGWVTARDVYRAILDHTPYPVRMLFSVGGNLLVSQPDSDQAILAMEQLEFHVHSDFFLNSSANYADIVLPVATSWEREGLRTGFDASVEGMRLVQLRPPVVSPVGEARSDTDIVLALGGRLGLSELLFDCDSDKGHNHILAPAGLSVSQLRAHPEGITLSTEVSRRPFAKLGDDDIPKGFPTPTRKIELYSETLLEHGYDPLPVLKLDPPTKADGKFPLRLCGAKTVAYCHGQHRNIESLRRLMPDPILEMPEVAAADRGIGNGDWVKVSTSAGQFVARARIVKNLEPGSVVGQHGWWVTSFDDSPFGKGNSMESNVNRAIETTLSDPISGSIPLRASMCNVAKLDFKIESE